MGDSSSVETGDTRERILVAALDVLAQRGYSAAGIQEIIDRSSTSKGSFYFHFPSKEKMVMGLVDQMSEKLVKKVQGSIQHQPTPLHRLAAGTNILLATFSRQRKVAQVLLLNIIGHGRAMDKKFLPVRERFSGLIQQEIEAAVAQGQIEPLDTALATQVWVGALNEVIVRWLLTGQPNPLVKVAPALKTMLLRSIGADPAISQD